MPDADHRFRADIGDHVVVRFANTPQLPAKVRGAVERSLEPRWAFVDGIENTSRDLSSGGLK